MRNRKQLLADFYLDLLALGNTYYNYATLKKQVASMLALELGSDLETIERIFERMASEDHK